MKKACIFPGQGSQAVGMGIAAAETFGETRALFYRASAVAGYDMYDLCQNGPIEKLSDTRYTQPALFTVEAALTEALRKNGVVFEAAAGHSLGEFAAWYAAGVMTFEDCLKLVIERGRLMAEADPEGRGTMAAVIGLGYDDVAAVCGSISGTVVVANINSPQQMVISGEKPAVESAGKVLQEKGAKRVLPLKVSGAFHSPLMADAKASFERAVGSVAISDAKFPVYANVTGKPVVKTSDIRRFMVEQLVSPVRWVDVVTTMITDGIGMAYEIGPGNVLAGLVKRIDERLEVKPAAEPKDIMEATK
jgi:[acyl-carrier-protein] S-malonyltransferase